MRARKGAFRDLGVPVGRACTWYNSKPMYCFRFMRVQSPLFVRYQESKVDLHAIKCSGLKLPAFDFCPLLPPFSVSSVSR
jgi:hypothetical protein